MVTQLSLPDHLFQELNRVASERQSTFDEVMREAGEKLVASEPRRTRTSEWKLPPAIDFGTPGGMTAFGEADVIEDKILRTDDFS